MMSNQKKTSLFLCCDCGHIDNVWSIKCSQCKKDRNFEYDITKNNDVNTISSRKKKIEI
jgi:predicted ATP-dependent serine protease